MGDIDDPTSGISKFLSITPVNVRTPEQGTRPNVYYVGADQTVLDPLAAPVSGSYLWAEPDPLRLQTAAELPGDPMSGARLTLNTAHPHPWGWKVWTYLWTKSVAAGAMMLAALMLLLTTDRSLLLTTVAPVVTELFLLVTAIFLVWDLKRPDRFWFLLIPWRLNRRSWLAIGGLFLGATAAIGGLWLLAGLTDAFGLGDFTSAIEWLAWPAIPLAAMVAGYTAFLFGQAEGRDLWQSPALFWHLQAQAVMAGAGILLVLSVIFQPDSGTANWLATALLLGIVAHLLISVVEFGGKHPTRNAEVAAHAIVRGRYARTFWGGSIGLSILAGALCLATILGASLLLAILGGLIVQAALLLHEQVYVKAAQDPPLS